MSKQFSNTTTKDGLIQILERKLGFNDGEISGNATRLAYFTGMLNSSLDKYIAKIFQWDGTAHFDDSNHTTPFPSIAVNLVSGTRSYAFTTDANSNLMLFIFKIMCADSNGIFHELKPIDHLRDRDANSFFDGLSVTGMPSRYGKQGKYVVVDLIPNFSYSGGLVAYVGREGSYFAVSDTTKTPGIAGSFHEILAIDTAWVYATDKVQARAKGLLDQKLLMEKDMEIFYGKRQKDENNDADFSNRITPFR